MSVSTTVAVTATQRSDEERAYYELTHRVYDSWFASSYDAITFAMRPLRRRVARLAGLGAGARVLDVATGTGAQARAFAARGATVVGVDLSHRMLAIARRKTRNKRIAFIDGDATALPVPDASFDASSISFALHEMPATVRARVIAELARATRPGGAVVIVDHALPRNRWWRAIVVGVVRMFEGETYVEFLHEDLDAQLERVGVDVRAVQPALLGAARIVIGVRR